MVAMAIQTEQKPTAPRGANGLHDDMVALKVDVAILKEQGKNFATKEDVARLETKIAEVQAENKQAMVAMDHKIEKAKNELLEAFNHFAVRVIVALVGVIVALGGILVTLILKWSNPLS